MRLSLYSSKQCILKQLLDSAFVIGRGKCYQPLFIVCNKKVIKFICTMLSGAEIKCLLSIVEGVYITEFPFKENTCGNFVGHRNLSILERCSY